MRVLNFLTAALLPLTALAAKKAPVDRFEAARAKQLAARGPLQLDDKSYEALTRTPRDYAVAVLFTALDARFACKVCVEFQPEWDLLAAAWAKNDQNGESRVVLATLDFLDGKNTFQALQMATAPVLFLHKPTTGPNADNSNNVERFDFTSGTAAAEPIHDWISRRLPGRAIPKFVRPFNWFKLAIGVTAVLGLITFGTVAAPYALPVLQNRNIWAAISLICVLLFTSGHMYNQIRGTPYVAGDGKGGIAYFTGGFQNQVGLETQLVAAIYGLLAFATISLALKVPRMTDPNAQTAAVFIWGAVILGTYSFLLSVFRIKNGGYPFWLPPF